MPSASDVFVDLFRYNAWANAKMFAVCLGLDASRLEANAPGTTGSIAETLTHMVGVEEVYLVMLQDQAIDASGNRDEYFAHDLTWFGDRAAYLGERYQAILSTFDDTRFASPLLIPWFDFPLTKRDGLSQVLTHSAQHRSQVLSVLGSAGIEVPNVDYVMLVRERQRTASD